ncbi:MAG: Asp-tRNA(Asn)/Glu-tRNA(Gln) amidotransferase subunit GatB [Leptospiraceae bacterium]|nr:Asp-tRNA(Asn)/Glu-tRNA(Gln) amidotransferase subunit GatB [Leptospiraceae bacterium]
MSAWEAVIGLEIHSQLKTKTKIFATDPYQYGELANTQAGPVTLALPGVLPVLNQEVLDLAILAGLALNCKIAEITKFDRKHYFYPDLPKAYQISQYDMPYAVDGRVEYAIPKTQGEHLVRIHRIHMEEDAGKLLHSHHPDMQVSYVDLNRAGVPLIEIVTEPDLRTSTEAYYFLATLRNILRYVSVTDGNMEEGSLRCDANVSVRPGPDAPFGTRVEIKNLNSFRAVQAAIDYEIERQIDVLESGGQVIQSTVLWDADARVTRLMRTKEDAEDYRYFPEPDLPPFYIAPAKVKKIANSMPELPDAKRKRYEAEYQLPPYDAAVLTQEKEIAEYFEATVKVCGDPKKSSNWVKDEVLGVINKQDIALTDFVCTPARLGRLIQLIASGDLTSKMAKQVFEHIYTDDMDVDAIIQKHGYKQMDNAELPALVNKLMAAHPDNVTKIKGGNERVKGFFVGQIMKATRGQANPGELNRLIDEWLQKSTS